MNAKKAKLLRKYARINKEDYHMLKKQFEKLPKDGQKDLIKHMRRYSDG